MHARVTETTSGDPAKGVEDYRDQVLPALRGLEGFVRAYLLIDRDSGESLSISVWETEEAMRAAEEAGAQLRASVTQDIGAQITAVKRYEVAVAEGSQPQ